MNDDFRDDEERSEPSNEERVERFAELLPTYPDTDDHSNLIDILADAMHWCKANGESFEDALRSAKGHFRTEVTEERAKGPQEGKAAGESLGELTEEEFSTQYVLVRNHLSRGAVWTYDDGQGCLFETYGPELDFVRRQDPCRVWTLMDTGDGGMCIRSGFHFTNRLGYFVSTAPVAEGVSLQVSIPTQREPITEKRNAMNQYEKNYERLTELLQGRDHVRIENEPYMALVIERMGHKQISLCHYGEPQNGDLMRDPEVVFLVSDTDRTASPVFFRNDYMAIDHCTIRDTFGDVPVKPQLQKELHSFVAQWWQNIKEQGFYEAAKHNVARETEAEKGKELEAEKENLREVPAGPNMELPKHRR